MTRKKSIGIVVASVLLMIAACFTIYWNANDEEMNVYVSMVESYRSLPAMKETAFLSNVSTCGMAVTPDISDQDQLLKSLFQANNSCASPRALERLSSMANVVNWKSTLTVHQSNGHIPLFQAGAMTTVKISRVGFNPAHDKAILCTELPDRSNLLFFEKAEGLSWRLVLDKNVRLGDLQQ